MDYKKRAYEIEDEIIENRRYLHQNPELGFELEGTIKFVNEKLKSYGIEPENCGRAGVTATVGEGEPVILLRGDMDALPMDEETGLEFASANGATHSCGHDTHTAMLLGAAKLLKENEKALKGTVKFMFQPAEELLGGAKDMISAGILENPKVDAAVGMHIFAGNDLNKTGTIAVARGQAMSSADAFNIIITGKQAHGSTPELGVDAILVGSYIVVGLQTILAREISMFDNAVVIVGKFTGGDTPNTLAGKAKLEMTCRAANETTRDLLIKRIEEIATNIAKTYHAEVKIEHPLEAPSLFNNVELTDEVVEIAGNLIGKENVKIIPMVAGTEDFAYVSQKVPSLMIILGGGTKAEGYEFGNHNPKFMIDESALPLGSALYAEIAEKYLENHAK